MDKKALGRQLRKYREAASYSQETLAELIDKSTIFISYMERGEKSPSLDTLIALANALNVPVDLLLGREVQNAYKSRLSYFEEKLCALPLIRQQKILDIFDAVLSVELEHYKSGH